MTDPFAKAERLAAIASIEYLAHAISPPAAIIEIEREPLRFQCPRCHHLDHNGGSAEIRGTWRWSCFRCRADSTIVELRRVALEMPDAVMALLASAQ